MRFSIFRRSVTSGLVLGLLATLASAQPQPSLERVTPSTAAPGDAVALHGQGFVRPAAAYVAWGFDGTRGFALEIEGKQGATRLDAVLGPVGRAAQGSVVLWQGQRQTLAPTSLAGLAFTFGGSVLLPARSAQGPSFQAQGGEGVSSRLVNGEIRLTLARSARSSGQPPEEEDTESGGLDRSGAGAYHSIVVVGIGGSCGPPDDSSDDGDGDDGGDDGEGFSGKWSFDIRIECTDGQLCRGQWANAVAAGLGQALGSQGVASRAEGRTVVLSHPQGICAGFANALPELRSQDPA